MESSTFIYFLGSMGVAISLTCIWLNLASSKCLQPKGYLKFAFTFSNNNKIQGDNLMARITILQLIAVALTPVDRKGNPAAIQAGSVKWGVSDPTLATITPDPENELKATITPTGLGVVQVTASADADPSADVDTEINGSAALEIVAAEATGFELKFDEPTDQA